MSTRRLPRVAQHCHSLPRSPLRQTTGASYLQRPFATRRPPARPFQISPTHKTPGVFFGHQTRMVSRDGLPGHAPSPTRNPPPPPTSLTQNEPGNGHTPVLDHEHTNTLLSPPLRPPAARSRTGSSPATSRASSSARSARSGSGSPRSPAPDSRPRRAAIICTLATPVPG